MGKILLGANAVIVGVRSPPLREMAKRWGEGLPGANQGTVRRPVFLGPRLSCPGGPVRAWGTSNQWPPHLELLAPFYQ